MIVAGSCAEVIFLTVPEDVELDTDQPTDDRALVASFRKRHSVLPEADQVDVDVTGNDHIGI
jgi:hypothetical protein